MKLLRSFRATPVALALLTTAAFAVPGAALAVPGERDKLNACKAMVERAGPPAVNTPENAELQKCRQIIKEWTLRDSRRSVDENGEPMK
jgi:hypothetical protein